MQADFPFVWDMLDLLGLRFPGQPVEFKQREGRRFADNERVPFSFGQHKPRYHFRKLHTIQWVQLDRHDPEQNDLRSMSVPPKTALLLARDAFARVAISADVMRTVRQCPVVYISRCIAIIQFRLHVHVMPFQAVWVACCGARAHSD